MRFAGRNCRKARMPARRLAPVAMPSSTRMTVSPATESGVVAAIDGLAALQFLLRSRGDAFDFGRGNRQSAKNLAVENADASGRDRSKGKFFLAGDAEFPEKEHVERGAQCGRNFERDGYAAARNTEYNHIVPVGIFFKPPRQTPAGFCAIYKNNGSTSCRSARDYRFRIAGWQRLARIRSDDCHRAA